MIPKLKHTLRFHKDGSFRVLMISDFHAGSDFSPKLTAGIDALLEHTKPDLVLLGGDQCLCRDNAADFRDYLARAVAPIEERELPWAHVFGNHDNEQHLPIREQEPIYESLPYCISSAGPEEVSGTGNYCLPVLSSRDDSVAYNIWALDSHRELCDYREAFGLPEETAIILPDCFGCGKVQASPFFDQVMWYYRSSLEMERQNGKKIPAILYMHVPIIEFNLIFRNPEECAMRGSKREAVYGGELNSGLFMACLQRGDVKGIFCGHEHLNDFQGQYCGITLAYDACVGYNMSAHDDLRGGRVIDLNEDGGFETHHVKLMDIMGVQAQRNPDFFEGGCPYFIRNIN